MQALPLRLLPIPPPYGISRGVPSRPVRSLRVRQWPPQCPSCLYTQSLRQTNGAVVHSQWYSNPVRRNVHDRDAEGGPPGRLQGPTGAAAAGHIADAAAPERGSHEAIRMAPWIPYGQHWGHFSPCNGRSKVQRSLHLGGEYAPGAPRWHHNDRGRPGTSETEAAQAPVRNAGEETIPQQKGQGTEPMRYTEGPLTLAEAEERQLREHTHKGLTLPGGIVDRYLPPRDPSALLLEPHKLTKEEQRFQILFAVLPWICFGCLLATPLALARYHTKKLRERQLTTIGVSRQLRRRLEPPALLLVSFPEIIQLVEQPHEILLLLTDSAAFGAHTTACLFAELAAKLRQHGIELPIAICDLHEKGNAEKCGKETTGGVSKQEREFPAAFSPYVLLLHPEGPNGEPAAQVLPELQEEGMLKSLMNSTAAQTLMQYIQSIRPAAAALIEEIEAMDLAATELLRCEFAEAFVDRYTHTARGPPSESPEGVPEQTEGGRQPRGPEDTSSLRVMGLAAALSACRERRRGSYPSVIV